MKFVAWHGLSCALSDISVGGHSPWQADVKDPDIICLPEVDDADPPSNPRRVVRGEGIRALAFIPLVARGKLIGKLSRVSSASVLSACAHTSSAAPLSERTGIWPQWDNKGITPWNDLERSRRVGLGKPLNLLMCFSSGVASP